MVTPMTDVPLSRDDPRAATSLDLRGVAIEVSVWRDGSSWRATALVGRREIVIMDAASHDDALTRLRESLLGNAEVARALGLAPARRLVGQPVLESR